MENIIWLPGRVIPKKRPIVTRNGTFMPKNYTNWQRGMIPILSEFKLPKPCGIECYFINFAMGDIDNLVGSIMDAMVKAGSIENDSSSHVCYVSGRFIKTKKKRGEEKRVGAVIKYYESKIFEASADEHFEYILQAIPQ